MSASIIAPLVISGSRKSDGTANASGKVWAYLPNTSTTAQLYSNPEGTLTLTQPLVLDQGGRVPSATAPNGVFTAIPIRLYIEDSSGVVVSDSLFTPATAATVSIDNDAMSGATMDAVLTASQTSFGGTDFKYLESSGATERTVKSKFSEIWISVKDFGAVGDGVAIDTTAIQATANRVKALGGGIVYFPPGTYLVDQAIVLTSATGVIYHGVRGATAMKLNNGTANAFTFATAATGCAVEGFTLIHTGTTTGSGISVAAGQDFAIRDVKVTDGDFTNAADFSGASNWFIQNSVMAGITRGVRSNISLTALQSFGLNSQFSGATAALELDGAGSNYSIFGGSMSGAAAGILFDATLTGGYIKVVGCRNTAATAFDMSALSTNPFFEQWGNGVDGYTVDVLSGATVTPNIARGNHIRVRGTTTGVAYVVAAPIPTPVSSTTQGGENILYLSFFNNAGGAVTGWTMNAVYHMSAGPSTVNLEKTNYIFIWEGDIGVWRELSRTVTT